MTRSQLQTLSAPPWGQFLPLPSEISPIRPQMLPQRPHNSSTRQQQGQPHPLIFRHDRYQQLDVPPSPWWSNYPLKYLCYPVPSGLSNKGLLLFCHYNPVQSHRVCLVGLLQQRRLFSRNLLSQELYQNVMYPLKYLHRCLKLLKLSKWNQL